MKKFLITIKVLTKSPQEYEITIEAETLKSALATIRAAYEGTNIRIVDILQLSGEKDEDL